MTDTPIQAEQGLRAERGDADRFEAVLELAVDYRGDVTVERTDGSSLDGFLFDVNGRGADACLRLLPANGGARCEVRANVIHALTLSGRDTAAGKSFETWVRKYVEKKRAGETASIESEPLA